MFIHIWGEDTCVMNSAIETDFHRSFNIFILLSVKVPVSFPCGSLERHEAVLFCLLRE